MSLFNNKYPYTDLSYLNLDFILEKIASLSNIIGEGSLTTTAQTIIGAINELVTGKQDKLTAGSNIQISESNVISATDTTYTAGANIQISESNVISATAITPVTQSTTITENVDGNAVTLDIRKYGDIITILSYYQLPSQSAKYQHSAYLSNNLPSWAIPTTSTPNDKIRINGFSNAFHDGTISSTDVFLPNAYTFFNINAETGQIALNVMKCESTTAPTGSLRDCYGSITYRL